MDDIKELIEYKILEIKNYIDDCFEKQSKDNAIFFDNILELIRANIDKEIENNIEELNIIICELKEIIELNKSISKKLLDDLKEIDDLYESVCPKIENEVIYPNIKKGVIQFGIQLIVTTTLLLIILGGYNLINLFI